MDKTQLQALTLAMRDGLEKLSAITVRCSTCKSWRVGRCAEFDSVPPEEVQIVGCEAWRWDQVPF